MQDSVDELIINNIKLIYVVLKKLHMYNFEDIDRYYDVGMIGLVRGAKKFDSSLGIKPSSYLTKCITNSILLEKRKENRPSNVNFDNTLSLSTIVHENITLEDILQSNVDIQKDIEKEESIEELYRAFLRLSKSEQIVLQHSYGIFNSEKLSQKDIANTLHFRQSNISKIKSRAIKKLRGMLKNGR